MIRFCELGTVGFYLLLHRLQSTLHVKYHTNAFNSRRIITIILRRARSFLPGGSIRFEGFWFLTFRRPHRLNAFECRPTIVYLQGANGFQSFSAAHAFARERTGLATASVDTIPVRGSEWTMTPFAYVFGCMHSSNVHIPSFLGQRFRITRPRAVRAKTLSHCSKLMRRCGRLERIRE